MNITVVDKSEGWNDWLAQSRYGDILQSWEWGEVKKGELWTALRVRAVKDDQVVAQAQILTRKMPLGMSLYYLPRGPVLDYESPEAAATLQQLLDWVKDHAAKHRGLMIKLGPAVGVAGVPNVLTMFDQLGLKPSFRSVQAQHTYIVDLRPDEMAIMQSFDKDTRNLVRRSAREGVVVDRFSDAAEHKGLRTFHNLYLAASEHGKFAPRPWSQFSRLWELMAPLGMARVYIASFEDKPLAANMVLRLGDKSYQLWAGSRRDEPKKFAPYALQWATMQDLKADGVASYDMWGRAPSDDPKHAWAGLSLFKKGFGGQEVEYVGDFDLPLSPTYPVFTTANKVRQRLLG
jgi:lipid II:glycine glycyltransferase (peptidoglycan interpeptide bridge formation enzyme)